MVQCYENRILVQWEMGYLNFGQNKARILQGFSISSLLACLMNGLEIDINCLY